MSTSGVREVHLSSDDLASRVRTIRSFNRFYTRRVGALDRRYLSSPFSLTESRVLFELANRGGETDALALRRELGLDPSYLSRILARFERDGLVRRERSSTDARRQVVSLTDKGRSTFADLDARAVADVTELLSGLGEADQERLVQAMATIQELLSDAPPRAPFVLRPLRPGDLGWIVHRHGVVYAEEYGWNESYEALVARIVADYVDHHDPARETGWIAEVDGEPVGSILCVRKDEETAQLRLLLVEPKARGMGIGSRLVEECLRFAKRVGYRRIVLWTTDVLTDARRIYERAGFVLQKAEPHHGFGKDLVGQWWSRDL
ncbi:MAG TPA: helix-turn-helix domain-containing GNAT family N-acetyltransferase [Actinopolymorphaceae bacterium]|jgi:DNA-binding MarR family transcriptional regulator/GNAT superfamily N-acetyltransferase